MEKTSAKFVLLFSIVAMSIYTFLEFVPESIYQQINHWNAVATVFLLKSAGILATIKGDLISYKTFTAKVVGECSAVFLSVLPLAFFLTYPKNIKWRLYGIFIGLPALFAFNLLRITFLFYIGFSYPNLFAWVHLYIGQVVMILLVIWICLIWLEWGNQKKTTNLKLLYTALPISILPFVTWIWLCEPYTRLILQIASLMLETAGFPIQLPKVLEIYPHTFISFNIILIFSGLIVKKAAQQKIRYKFVFVVILSLVGLHLIFQILPFLFFQYQIKQSGWAINFLLVLNQFIVPFVFWFFLLPRLSSQQS